MNTTISPINSVEFEFVLEIPASELTPYIENKLRQVGKKASMPGFRPGKMPKQLVKKIYGEAAAFEVVDKLVKDTFEDEVLANPEYDLLGTPKITTFDYEDGKDLRAVIQFGVRPEFELTSLEGVEISRLVNPVTPEDVKGRLDYLLLRKSMLQDSDAPVGEKSIVIVDMAELDNETKEVVDGGKHEKDATIILNDPNLLPEFKTELMGKNVGDVVVVVVSREVPHGDHTHKQTLTWQLVLKKIQERIYPELNDDLAKEFSNGRVETLQELESMVEQEIIAEREKRSNDMFENKLVSKALELNDFEVPSIFVENMLDNMVEAYKKEKKRTAPDVLQSFDEAHYRSSQYKIAYESTKWFALRDKIIEVQDLEITEEDYVAYYDEMAKSFGFIDGPTLRGIFENNQEGSYREEANSKILSGKVIDFLTSQVRIVEKSRADFDRQIIDEDLDLLKSAETEISSKLAEMEAENADEGVISVLVEDLDNIRAQMTELNQERAELEEPSETKPE